MASTGGPASIITQVSQNSGPPINALTAGMFGVYDGLFVLIVIQVDLMRTSP